MEEAKEKNHFITYKDKEIYYIDYKGLLDKELLNTIIVNVKKIEELGEKRGKLLIIFDYTDTFASEEVMEYLKSNIEYLKYIKKSAILGIIGIKKILLNVFNKLTNSHTVAFNTIEEAKDWLVKD